MTDVATHLLALAGVGVAALLGLRVRAGRSPLIAPAGFQLPSTANALVLAGVTWVVMTLVLAFVPPQPLLSMFLAQYTHVMVALLVLRAARRRASWPLRDTPRLLAIGAGGALVTFVAASYAVGHALRWLLDTLGTPIPEQWIVEFARAADGTEFAAIFVTAVVMAPFAEEVFFRGILLPALAHSMPTWLANVLQATAFGAIHVLLAPHLWPLAVPLSLVGWLLGLAYTRTGSLRVVVAMHAGFNAIELLLLRTGT